MGIKKATYVCGDCFRKVDTMIDGRNEMLIGDDICDKCFYGEWTERELDEIRYEKDKDICPRCRSNGCNYCLMLEPFSFT